MATRSYIGIRLTDDKFTYIYCHFDGYPSHVGEILKKFYNTKDKVNELLELGDISYFDGETGYANAYHRDMKRDYRGPRTDEHYEVLKDDGVDYIYTFDEMLWECYNTTTRKYVQGY